MKKQAVSVQQRKPKPVRTSSAKRRSRPAAPPQKAKTKPSPAPKAMAAKPQARPAPKAEPVRPRVPDKQQLVYGEAVRMFQAQRFDRADALFRKAMDGPNRALAHHAQVHSQICRMRLRPPEVKLKSADDHYNYAVTMMNARRLSEAAEHLEKALQMAPQADHLHYALAATEALKGNAQGAYERLKRAIDLQPRNRHLARSDADFAGILEYPPLASLLQIDRGWSPKTPL